VHVQGNGARGRSIGAGFEIGSRLMILDHEFSLKIILTVESNRFRRYFISIIFSVLTKCPELILQKYVPLERLFADHTIL
jgi:hypothetical protein